MKFQGSQFQLYFDSGLRYERAGLSGEVQAWLGL